MAFDCRPRKLPLLYADLFKPSAGKGVENYVATSNPEGSSLISSSSSQLSSPCGSSSSGFSTPLYSDFESEGSDFIAELSRQMAELMLEEEDDVGNAILSANGSAKKNERVCVDGSSSSTESLDNGIESVRVRSGGRIIPIQIQNQPPRRKEDYIAAEGRRVKRTGTFPPKTLRHHHRQAQYGLRNGSGMHAVFLGGSGSVNRLSGTGVFLPRQNNDPTEPKKKSGCSIVLMPTRVLQTLELHFKQRHQSLAQPPQGVSKGHSQLQKGPPTGDEIQLPQEWTY